MSKRQRTPSSRGVRRAPAPPNSAAFDPLSTAREIVAALADAIVVTGIDRRVATVNRAAAELFGRPLEDLPGTAVDDLLAPVERQHVAEREQLGYAGEEQRYETKVLRPDGVERDVAVSSTPLLLDGHLA